MNTYIKGIIAGMLITIIACALCYLLFYGRHDLFVFLAQSTIDNALFCGMFILVVLVTGINC